VLGSFLRRDELDFARMSANSFEVGTFSNGVLGTDDLATPVLLHSQQCLIGLRWNDLGSFGQLDNRSLRWCSF
jgi:hypothetical protein